MGPAPGEVLASGLTRCTRTGPLPAVDVGVGVGTGGGVTLGVAVANGGGYSCCGPAAARGGAGAAGPAEVPGAGLGVGEKTGTTPGTACATWEPAGPDSQLALSKRRAAL